ncbi:hypothetical protein CEXT_404031 [Caerostris extrusa]|uniref:Uncharacterized protein n=1 Tax=Caerostris extrusa TaxID=172846 RepID=A0AAV4T5W1_CAEEX|nr:hypothetical protein CEXT_404031 [Caerostris extrusa]
MLWDRVLTPSIFRVKARTGHAAREFGTQTDIHYGNIQEKMQNQLKATQVLSTVQLPNVLFAYNTVSLIKFSADCSVVKIFKPVTDLNGVLTSHPNLMSE